MGLFNKNTEPHFLKESSNAQSQLDTLRALEPQLNPEGKIIIRQDIKKLEYGIAGEKNIAFELKNSHMYMCILHDVYLEDGDLSAQIDYLVFTKKMCFVIECKNLYGDIEITNSGDFIRTIEFGGRKKREGIYSPITQNQRHLDLMKKIRLQNSNNPLFKLMGGKYFEDFHKTVVVLANPKTILNAKYAKKEDKQKVIRADQLVKHIKDVYAQSKELEDNEAKVLEWAHSYKSLHKDVEKDYTSKYEEYKITSTTVDKAKDLNTVAYDASDVSIPIEDTDIYKELKAFRLKKSREENIKPYFIYSNKQLEDLIAKMPRIKEHLLNVHGFGEGKVSKYGEEIIEIVNKY